MVASTKTTSKVRRRTTLSFNVLVAIILSAVTTFTGIQLFHGTTTSSFNAAAAETVPSKGVGGVITLDTKNFDSSIADGKVWLIEFYAPWCGHCVRFASTYEQIATELHTKQQKAGVRRKINVAKVDGAAERALASRFSVHGFPTFFLVDGWKTYKFEGNRSKESLTQFALNGYEKEEPVAFLFGPFGPVGTLRSFLMRSGNWAVGLYESLTKDKGFSPLMAMAILCVGGLTCGLISIIVVGLLFLPKAKLD